MTIKVQKRWNKECETSAIKIYRSRDSPFQLVESRSIFIRIGYSDSISWGTLWLSGPSKAHSLHRQALRKDSTSNPDVVLRILRA